MNINNNNAPKKPESKVDINGVADIMDNILNKMKTHIQHLQDEQNNNKSALADAFSKLYGITNQQSNTKSLEYLGAMLKKNEADISRNIGLINKIIKPGNVTPEVLKETINRKAIKDYEKRKKINSKTGFEQSKSIQNNIFPAKQKTSSIKKQKFIKKLIKQDIFREDSPILIKNPATSSEVKSKASNDHKKKPKAGSSGKVKITSPVVITNNSMEKSNIFKTSSTKNQVKDLTKQISKTIKQNNDRQNEKRNIYVTGYYTTQIESNIKKITELFQPIANNVIKELKARKSQNIINKNNAKRSLKEQLILPDVVVKKLQNLLPPAQKSPQSSSQASNVTSNKKTVSFQGHTGKKSQHALNKDKSKFIRETEFEKKYNIPVSIKNTASNLGDSDLFDNFNKNIKTNKYYNQIINNISDNPPKQIINTVLTPNTKTQSLDSNNNNTTQMNSEKSNLNAAPKITKSSSNIKNLDLKGTAIKSRTNSIKEKNKSSKQQLKNSRSSSPKPVPNKLNTNKSKTFQNVPSTSQNTANTKVAQPMKNRKNVNVKRFDGNQRFTQILKNKPPDKQTSINSPTKQDRNVSGKVIAKKISTTINANILKDHGKSSIKKMKQSSRSTININNTPQKVTTTISGPSEYKKQININNKTPIVNNIDKSITVNKSTIEEKPTITENKTPSITTTTKVDNKNIEPSIVNKSEKKTKEPQKIEKETEETCAPSEDLETTNSITNLITKTSETDLEVIKISEDNVTLEITNSLDALSTTTSKILISEPADDLNVEIEKVVTSVEEISNKKENIDFDNNNINIETGREIIKSTNSAENIPENPEINVIIKKSDHLIEKISKTNTEEIEMIPEDQPIEEKIQECDEKIKIINDEIQEIINKALSTEPQFIKPLPRPVEKSPIKKTENTNKPQTITSNQNVKTVVKPTATPSKPNAASTAKKPAVITTKQTVNQKPNTPTTNQTTKQVNQPITKPKNFQSKASLRSNQSRGPSVVNQRPKSKFEVLTPMEVVQDFVNMVSVAKKEKKTYTVCGNFYSLRRAFAERGWVEKLRINLMDDKEAWRKIENLTNYELVEGMKNKDNGEKYRKVFITKLLAGHQVDFYWDYLTNPFSVNNDRVKRTLINRFPFGATRYYTTKHGLCESLKDSHWYCIDGFANILYPRTYNLGIDEDVPTFLRDFKRTAAISLLEFIIMNSSSMDKFLSTEGQIPISVFNFAIIQCQTFLKEREHKDVDETLACTKDCEWDVFLEKFYKIIHFEQKFMKTSKITPELMVEQARFVLNKVKKFLPDVHTDGYKNMWLLKPSNGSRGCGIHVCRTLKYILDTVEHRKDVKYVVQKYIERPLLIHKTKFDIRQWFLVTCMPNLKIWIYKECYLRFSSQVYDLGRLHESIHLTNNSIQCRYKNNLQRSSVLPDQNMWHSDTFRRYLSDIGQPYVWRNIIYKGMKECLIGLFMLCHDKIEQRINSFELCGADFMLNEDYRPYLIEINSRPALYPSTKITAKLCPKVLEDVIKVVVDNARNPRASTGDFELIFTDTFNYAIPRPETGLEIKGISYFEKFANNKKEKAKDIPLDQYLPLKEVIQSNTTQDTTNEQGTTIQKLLNLDPTKVRKDVRNALHKILSMIHDDQNNEEISKEVLAKRNKQFRAMLSEFVNIISTGNYGTKKKS